MNTIPINHPKGRFTAIGYRRTVIRLSTLSSYLFSFKKALPLHVFFMVTHLFCGGKPARQAFFVQVRACFAQLAPERLQRRAGVCIIKMRPRDKHKQRGRGC